MINGVAYFEQGMKLSRSKARGPGIGPSLTAPSWKITIDFYNRSFPAGLRRCSCCATAEALYLISATGGNSRGKYGLTSIIGTLDYRYPNFGAKQSAGQSTNVGHDIDVQCSHRSLCSCEQQLEALI